MPQVNCANKSKGHSVVISAFGGTVIDPELGLQLQFDILKNFILDILKFKSNKNIRLISETLNGG